MKGGIINIITNTERLQCERAYRSGVLTGLVYACVGTLLGWSLGYSRGFAIKSYEDSLKIQEQIREMHSDDRSVTSLESIIKNKEAP